eukprot:15975442-Heterocapsa_arctica.AAC.1
MTLRWTAPHRTTPHYTALHYITLPSHYNTIRQRNANEREQRTWISAPPAVQLSLRNTARTARQ